MPEEKPLAFEYLEIRPCIERGGYINSYVDETEYETALEGYKHDDEKLGQTFKTFWTLYGRYNDGDGAFLALAIGDFTTKKDAHEVMNAILAPMAKARNLIWEEGEKAVQVSGKVPLKAYERAASDLDDFINQCSNEERV